jgi:hypothetical protein
VTSLQHNPQLTHTKIMKERRRCPPGSSAKTGDQLRATKKKHNPTPPTKRDPTLSPSPKEGAHEGDLHPRTRGGATQETIKGYQTTQTVVEHQGNQAWADSANTVNSRSV